MVLRHVAFGDRDEAGEPRFRREQVVERGVEPARAVGVGEAIADREDAPAPVVEEVEPHAVGERRRRVAASAASASRGTSPARRRSAATRVDARARHQNAMSLDVVGDPARRRASATRCASSVAERLRARRVAVRRARVARVRDDGAREPVDRA